MRSAPRFAEPRPIGRNACEFFSIAGVGYEASPTSISCAAKTTSTACRNFSISKPPSSRANFMRFREARLQAESSMNMYSEHGFDALMRCVALHGFHALMSVSYCIPGSPHTHADSAIFMRSEERRVGKQG